MSRRQLSRGNRLGNLFDDEQTKKLTKLWYGKLKESGFDDIEDTRHKDSPLFVWHSLKWQQCSPEKVEAIQTYYAQANDLLNTYEFENETHRKIWELHCEGASKRKIERTISSYEKTYKREQIGNIINLIASTIL